MTNRAIIIRAYLFSCLLLSEPSSSDLSYSLNIHTITSYDVGRIAIFRSLLMLTWSTRHISFVPTTSGSPTVRSRISHGTIFLWVQMIMMQDGSNLSSSCLLLAHRLSIFLYHIHLMIPTVNILYKND